MLVVLKSRGYSRSRSESCDAAPIPASPFKFSFVDSFRPCKRGSVFYHPYLYEKPPHEGGGLVRSDAARIEHLVDLIESEGGEAVVPDMANFLSSGWLVIDDNDEDDPIDF